MRPGTQELRSGLSHRHRRRRRATARHDREHGEIDDAQLLEPVHAQLGVDDGVRIAGQPHRGGAAQVLGGGEVRGDPAVERPVRSQDRACRLDPGTEAVVEQALERLMEGRTVIVVAHRLSTVRRADRIITIEKGQIVEDGTHDELIRGKGRYATLHMMQSGLHEVA